jgi:hypothetical protein
MRRLAGLAILLLVAPAPAWAGAQEASANDCNPLPDLIFNGAEPVLREIAAGVGRVHFVKDGSEHKGCPSAGPSCVAPLFVIQGDAVVVTGTKGDFACATYTGAAPKAASTSGWLPIDALVLPRPASHDGPGADADWLGDWRSGPEQHIQIGHNPDGRIDLEGEATFGGRDPDRVKRGAVNTGDFSATVALAGGHLAFLVGDGGNPLAYDSERAKKETLCGLRFWRMGPYLVAADNLQCGGNNVTFTGVYRRVGAPP